MMVRNSPRPQRPAVVRSPPFLIFTTRGDVLRHQPLPLGERDYGLDVGEHLAPQRQIFSAGEQDARTPKDTKS